jgi:hypothetical protein
MAAAGYMTEVDTESIWDTTLDTTRFGKINVRLGEVLNFWVTGDAATDVTDTKVLPILEQLSEEALIKLIAAAKITAPNNPWDFIMSKAWRIASGIVWENKQILQEMGIVLSKKYHYTESSTLSLPQDITSLSKRTTS